MDDPGKPKLPADFGGKCEQQYLALLATITKLCFMHERRLLSGILPLTVTQQNHIYNELRSVIVNGTSTRFFSLLSTISAAMAPIFLKSVEIVVMPSSINLFHGVSL